MKILTKHVYPPIPIRSFDWLACDDDRENGPQGWGATKEEALQDLIDWSDDGTAYGEEVMNGARVQLDALQQREAWLDHGHLHR